MQVIFIDFETLLETWQMLCLVQDGFLFHNLQIIHKNTEKMDSNFYPLIKSVFMRSHQQNILVSFLHFRKCKNM